MYTYSIIEAISEMPAHCNFGDVTIHVLVSLMIIFWCDIVYCILEDLKHLENEVQ